MGLYPIKKDEKINFDKFTNVILITGLSGSGKSTLSKEYAKKYENSIVIEIDFFFWYYVVLEKEKLTEGEKLIYQYITKIKPELMNEKEKHIPLDHVDKYCYDFIKWVLKKARKDKNHTYIIEGIQIYCFIPYSEISEYPIVLKNTTKTKSMLRQWKREGGSFQWIKQLFDINDTIYWMKKYKKESDKYEYFKNDIYGRSE